MIRNFLEVTFHFSEKKKLKVIMNSYVHEIIDEADGTLKRKQRDQANTPANI